LGVSVRMRTKVVQRLRVTFGVDGPLIYASVLDMARLWERLLRRARILMAHTQGYNPRPRLQFAAALPVGYSSCSEILDLYLGERTGLKEFLADARAQCPKGLAIIGAEEVPIGAVSLQPLIREAHYRVRIWAEESPHEIRAATDRLLARPEIVRQRLRKRKMVDYDLRRLLHNVRLSSSADGQHELQMVVSCGQGGSGRPEAILDELGLQVCRYTIHRTRLVWDEGEEGGP
jgi:radical SAM-linked protein